MGLSVGGPYYGTEMAYRKCPNHGWLATHEYSVCSKTGETICPECGVAVSGYKEKTPAWYNRKRSPTHDFEPPEQVYGACGERCVHDEAEA
jgi:uncharacterized Zn finger protein (UPF0148 family)